MPFVFLSHSSLDRRLADEVYSYIRDAFDLRSEDIFYSSDDRSGVASGSLIDPAVQSALKSAPVFLALVTSNYKASPYCMCEAGAAWGATPDSLFPALVYPLEFDDLPGVLRGRIAQRIDPSDPKALESLENHLAQRLKRPATVRLASRAERLDEARTIDVQLQPLGIIDGINFDRAYPDDTGNLVPLDEATVKELQRIRSSKDVFEPQNLMRWNLANHFIYASDRERWPFVLKVVAFEGCALSTTVRLVSHALTSAQDPSVVPDLVVARPRVFARFGNEWRPMDKEVTWVDSPDYGPGERVLHGILSANLVSRRLRLVTASYVPRIFSYPDPTLFFSLSTHRAVARTGHTRYVLSSHRESRGRYVRRLFCYATQSGLEAVEHAPFQTRWAKPPPALSIDPAFVSGEAVGMLQDLAGQAAGEVEDCARHMLDDGGADCQFWVDNACDGVAQADGPGLRQRRLLMFYKRG